jgi:hypothetical protein
MAAKVRKCCSHCCLAFSANLEDGTFGSKAPREQVGVEENCREWDDAVVFGSCGAVIAMCGWRLRHTSERFSESIFLGKGRLPKAIGQVDMKSIQTAEAGTAVELQFWRRHF